MLAEYVHLGVGVPPAGDEHGGPVDPGGAGVAGHVEEGVAVGPAVAGPGAGGAAQAPRRARGPVLREVDVEVDGRRQRDHQVAQTREALHPQRKRQPLRVVLLMSMKRVQGMTQTVTLRTLLWHMLFQHKAELCMHAITRTHCNVEYSI